MTSDLLGNDATLPFIQTNLRRINNTASIEISLIRFINRINLNY